jgi:hypothetical protein
VVFISGLMNFLRKDIAYALVILCALAGIAGKFPAEGVITMAVSVTFELVVMTLASAFLSRRVKAPSAVYMNL